MIDKLIDKYKKNYDYLNQFVITDRTEFDSEEDYIRAMKETAIKETYREIFKDLEELKEKINNLDITSINAPSIVITQILKNEIIGGNNE